MDQISLFSPKNNIIHAEADVIVVPVNDKLSTSGIHKTCTRVIRDDRYFIQQVSERCKKYGPLKHGDTIIITNPETAKPDLMLAVLSISDKEHSAGQLQHFYTSVFKKINEHKFTSVAIPALSTGIFKYDEDEVVNISITIAKGFYELISIQLYCYNKAYFKLYTTTLAGNEL